jgi:hypothetical protein
VTVTLSEILSEMENGNGCARESGTSSQIVLSSAHQILILSGTLTAAHKDDLRLSTSTSTLKRTGTGTAISSPCLSVPVLFLCEPDTPYARLLDWGDMSPYGSDDYYGGASETVGVSALGRLHDDQGTF